MSRELSIVIPAKNEREGLSGLLPVLVQDFPDAEIIVVNDGSSDDTLDICTAHNVTVVSHPYSMGNGAAIKSGARIAKGSTLVFMDADRQHDPSHVGQLIAALNSGHDMAVAARDASSQANLWRKVGNAIYNRLASWIVGHEVKDLTSGFRAVRADKFRKFIDLLPNGFSYPTTITMSFFRAGYAVCYVPFTAGKRIGKSHIKLMTDGMRFLLIIFKIGTLYTPLKLFLPISLAYFFLGTGYYIYTYITFNRFTNMSALLFIASMLIFLIGLVSEQVTTLIYSQYKEDD